MIKQLEKQHARLRQIAAEKLNVFATEVNMKDFEDGVMSLDVTVFYCKKDGSRSNLTATIYSYTNPLTFSRLENQLRVELDGLKDSKL